MKIILFLEVQKVDKTVKRLSVCLGWAKFFNLFSFSVYFCYYSWGLTTFFGTIHEFYYTIQLTFTFIYNTFRNKISIFS